MITNIWTVERYTTNVEQGIFSRMARNRKRPTVSEHSAREGIIILRDQRAISNENITLAIGSRTYNSGREEEKCDDAKKFAVRSRATVHNSVHRRGTKGREQEGTGMEEKSVRGGKRIKDVCTWRWRGVRGGEGGEGRGGKER